MKWFVFPKKETKSSSLLFSLEVVGAIAAAWLIVYPKPYIFIFSIVLGVPIVRLLLYAFQKNTLIATLPLNKGNDYSDITDFIDFTTIALAYRVLMDISIADKSLKITILYSIFFFLCLLSAFFLH